MWRDYRQKSPTISSINPRLRLFAALIFLLLAAIVYRLYFLQVSQGDWYAALASGQHQISSLLQPVRGKIMLHEKLNGQDQLYPLATNKDFSFLYAVPKDIKNPQDLADKLFDFFDKPELEAKAKRELEAELKNNLQKEIDFINASAVEDVLSSVRKKGYGFHSLARLTTFSIWYRLFVLGEGVEEIRDRLSTRIRA